MGSISTAPQTEVVAPGTALIPNPPTLFTPLRIRDLQLHNRIVVAPMCTYSAVAGAFTDWHLVHHGAFAVRGAALTIVEATAVVPEGRITPDCAGLWDDAHVAPLKKIADFVHAVGGKIGVQLAHAGRKGSCLPPHTGLRRPATGEEGGWTVKGASTSRWGEGYPLSEEMSTDEVVSVQKAFAAAARRAVAAGVDMLEIHAAHGYLLNEFLSPLTNLRGDRYGGDFDGRSRLLLETVREVRAVIPPGMPLFVRISATEWVDGGWTEADSVRLARLLPALGVDLLDVSSGGNSEHQAIEMHNGYQVGIAGRIRQTLKTDGVELLVGAVGLITEAEMAREIVQVREGKDKSEGESEERAATDGVEIENERGEIQKADLVLVARQFLREPEWVLRVAQRLGIRVHWPRQYARAAWRDDAKL